MTVYHHKKSDLRPDSWPECYSVSNLSYYLPGLYATREAALVALKQPECMLWELDKRVVRNEKRLITMDDLRAAGADIAP